MSLALAPAEAVELNKLIERWAGDPVAFVREVFGPGYEAEKNQPLVIDKWQLRGLRVLVRHEPNVCGSPSCSGAPHNRVAVRACKGPGKTAWEAWVGWWRLLTRRFAKGIAVSITGDNLKTNLWSELSLWQRYSPLLTALFEHTGAAITSRDHKDWKLEARAFPQDADKSKQAETLAGLHGDSVFVLLDEVGSFPQGVLDAAQAIFNVRGQEALLVVAGNATTVEGPLYRICTEEADRFCIIEITGDPDDPERSPRIDIDEARAQIAKYGRNDPVVMVNILGKFPPRSSNKLLGPDDCAAAEKRVVPRSAYEREPEVWGLDVAAEGDDSSKLYKRKGPVARDPRTWHGLPTDLLADQVALDFHIAHRRNEAPRKIFVDKGGVGRGTYDRLRTLLGAVVVGVDFGESALDDTLYANRRTEMWCLMAAWVREQGCIPAIPELRRDLTRPTIGTESTTSKGTRRMLESKKTMGKPSPDDGDGLALTFAAPVLSEAMEAIVGRHQAQAQSDFDPYAFMAR